MLLRRIKNILKIIYMIMERDEFARYVLKHEKDIDIRNKVIRKFLAYDRTVDELWK